MQHGMLALALAALTGLVRGAAPLTVPQVASPPVVDGQFADKAWAQVVLLHQTKRQQPH